MNIFAEAFVNAKSLADKNQFCGLTGESDG